MSVLHGMKNKCERKNEKRQVMPALGNTVIDFSIHGDI